MRRKDELKKMSRLELMELLVLQSEEIDKLRNELEEYKEKLESRRLEISKAGSIAEASLKINGVFEAAEAAASQYLENIKRLYEEEAAAYNRMAEKSAEEHQLLEKAERSAEKGTEV
jgi:5-bromo-4-chloroindolyl phosphate hydrolysis protein